MCLEPQFGKLSVYFCLRSDVPQLYLELVARGIGLPLFRVAYRMMYWDD